ncbi:hypothetical protein [Ferruginibacter sp.]|nr:hypothetical protein [Ferruginibacter sp.]
MSISEKLTSVRWKVNDVQIGVGLSVVQDCDLDNIITLNPDSTVLFDRGVNLCDTLEQRMVTSYWQLKDDGKKINLMGWEYEIAVLSKEDLRLWLRNYVTPNYDTLDIYMMFKSVPR